MNYFIYGLCSLFLIEIVLGLLEHRKSKKGNPFK